MNSNAEHIYNVAARLISPQDIGLGKDKLRFAARLAESKIATIQLACLVFALLSVTLLIAVTAIFAFEPHKRVDGIINPFYLSVGTSAIFIISIALPDAIQFYKPLRKWFKLPDICNPPELLQFFEALQKESWEAVNAKGENIPEYLFESEWRVFLIAGPSFRHRRAWIRHVLSKAYTDDILVRPLESTAISWAFPINEIAPSNDSKPSEADNEIIDYFLWQLDEKSFREVIKNTPHLMGDKIEAIKIKFALDWCHKRFNKAGSLSDQKWKYLLYDFAKDLKDHATKLRQNHSISNFEYDALIGVGLTGKDDDKWLRDLRKGKYVSICRKLEESYKSLKIV